MNVHKGISRKAACFLSKIGRFRLSQFKFYKQLLFFQSIGNKAVSANKNVHNCGQRKFAISGEMVHNRIERFAAIQRSITVSLTAQGVTRSLYGN